MKNKIRKIFSAIILFICAGYFCFEAASITWKGYHRFVWADRKYREYRENRNFICWKVANEGLYGLDAVSIAEKLDCNKQEFVNDVYESYMNKLLTQ